MTIRQTLQEKALLKNETINQMLLQEVSTREELTKHVWKITKEIFHSFSSIDALIFGTITVAIEKEEKGWNFRIILGDFDDRKEIESKDMFMKTNYDELDMQALKAVAKQEGLIFVPLEESVGCAFTLKNV